MPHKPTRISRWNYGNEIKGLDLATIQNRIKVTSGWIARFKQVRADLDQATDLQPLLKGAMFAQVDSMVTSLEAELFWLEKERTKRQESTRE